MKSWRPWGDHCSQQYGPRTSPLPCWRNVALETSSLLGPGVAYLLEFLIGGAGVRQETIWVEDAAGIVLVAPEVVAGYKVCSS